MRWPGIEPGSTAWKATMLTITPPSHLIYYKSVVSKNIHFDTIINYNIICQKLLSIFEKKFFNLKDKIENTFLYKNISL